MDDDQENVDSNKKKKKKGSSSSSSSSKSSKKKGGSSSKKKSDKDKDKGDKNQPLNTSQYTGVGIAVSFAGTKQTMRQLSGGQQR
jgi:hypothetical protein